MLQPVRDPHRPTAAGPFAVGFPLKFSVAEATHDPSVLMPRKHNAEIYEDLLKVSNEQVKSLAMEGASSPV